MKFTGSNVLVTGASRGIGAEIAKTLAGFGLKVWINYRSGAGCCSKIQRRNRKQVGKQQLLKLMLQMKRVCSKLKQLLMQMENVIFSK